MKKLLLAALVAAIPLAAHAADPVVNPGHLATDIKVLSSDAFEGRGPATPGGDKAVAWIIGQMIAAGLEPGGDLKDGKRAWTQDVPLGRFEMKGPVTSSFSVGGQSIALNQGEQIAIRAAQTNVDSVSLAGLPVVFAGYGVRAPERNWDDFAGMDVKGKVVIVLINDPDFESGKGDFGGKAMTYYGRWTYKYEEAARLGAAALIIVHETDPASYGWATVKNSNTNTMFDIVRDKPAEVHPPVEAWIQRDVAVDLFRRAGLDFDALKKKAAKRGFKAVALPGVTFSTDFKVDHQVIVSQNVAGVLPGATRPDERVFYTAHWDHLGVGLPDASGDTIYNGAVDNATGVAALLELGRMYAAAPRPDRSVVFLAVTAEEKGLLGSEYYAANPLYPLATTVADLNMDGFSPTGPSRDYTTSGDGKVSLQDDLVAALKARGRVFTPDPVPEAGHFFRSDHFPFAKRGVPAISVGPGEDLVVGGVAAGKAYNDMYIKDRYHQPADEWSDDWDLSGMATDLTLLYDLGRDLATSTRWPEWQAGSEFKAVRDATAAERQ
ncbi:MAG TPA: M28 family metallopeptidase [Caulobacter sp.]|nr:M28 family metallopeptidase [Caulobacter sp.]